MAIIGDLYDIRSRYFQSKNDIVFNYLIDACTFGTDVNVRIQNLPMQSFEKVSLGPGIFALEQRYVTKERNDCFIESHINYIDFQLHLTGTEQMEFGHIENLEVKTPYDSQKDLIVYKDSDDLSKLTMKEGLLVIFLPEDAHMGLPMYAHKPSTVCKTVVKLPIEKFEV